MEHSAQPAWWSAQEMTEAFASGRSTPSEVHQAVQSVIEEREPEVNAFWQRDAAASAEAAQASTRRWTEGRPLSPLDGVPVTVKENVARAGVPMPAGCAGVDPTVPERDAPITERLLEAGAVILGSTVMPDWGMLSSGVSSLHGITRSPLDPSLTTGGSSSGAGAAAAAGYGPLHVGSDIGGSIRLPGTWLGLATLKPSAGRVPLDAPYLGRVAGPMGRSVGDLAAMMAVISQPDPRDWDSLPASEIDWQLSDLEPESLVVGLQLDAGCGIQVDPEVREAVERVGAELARAGARVVPVEPWMDERLLGSLDLFWRVRSYVDLTALPPERQERVLPFIRRWVSVGAEVSGAELMRCYTATNEIRSRTVAATQPYDLVISPVAPMAAFPAEWPMPWGDDDLGMQHIGFTAPYNMSGQPAGTVDAGRTSDGRTIGVQVAGPRFGDLEVLRGLRLCEGVTGATT